MRTILSNKQKWNNRGVELTINFIVTLILALSAFALGAVIIKTLTSGGADSVKLTQDQLNKKISQLSCSSRSIICISNNNKAVTPGDVGISGLAVFNYLNNQATFTINLEPVRANTVKGDFDKAYMEQGESAFMPNKLGGNDATLTIDAKTQDQLAIGIITYKETPKGTYVFKVKVTSTDAGFADIGDLLTVNVK